MAQHVIVEFARRDQTALVALLLTWGAAAVIAQSILLRETTVLFFAGEISWGIMLFAWLVGVGFGAALGGSLSRRVRRVDRWLACFVAAFALAGPLSIVLLRSARGWLDVGPGQYIPLAQMAWLSGLLVSPFGLLIGVAFPLACRAVRGQDDAARIGRVYLIESAGSLVGGLAFTFVLVGRVNAPTLLALWGAGLLAAAAIWLRARQASDTTQTASGTGRRHDASHAASAPNLRNKRLAAAPAIGACVLCAAALSTGDRIDAWSILRRWRTFASGLDLRASIESRYQNLALGWREGQFGLYANGHPTMTFPEPTALRWPGQVALCQHPNPRRVLLLGGGVNGMLAEVLTHTCVERVDLVELDPEALRLVRPFLPERDRRALDDSRTEVIHEDARRFVQDADGPYDMVIGRFGPPASAMVARFYTVEFYRRLAEIMSPDGVLVFETETSPAELRPESAACTASIDRTLREVFDDVVVGWGPNPLVLACRSTGVLTTDVDLLARRLAARGVSAGHFAPEDFAMSDQLNATLVAKRRAELNAVPRPAINTDFHPAIYLLWLQRWEQEMRERTARRLEQVDTNREFASGDAFARLGRFQPGTAAALVGLALAAWLGWRLARHGRGRGLAAGIVLGSLGSTGFATMAAEVVILFAYQSLRGYVYEQVGAVIGLFMFGLCLGSAGMNRLLLKRSVGRSWLAGLDLILAAMVLAVPTLLAVADRAGQQWLMTVVIYGGVVAFGVLGGAAFPLGARFHGALDGRAERTAGAIDAADHLGACLGALFTGVILVPGIGIQATCVGLAGLKGLSAVGVWLGALGRGRF